MRKNGIIFEMQNKGIEWVFIGGVDKVLVKMVDPVLIGLSVEKKVLAAGKSVVKEKKKKKVGVFCKKDGKPSVIEYSEISNELAEAVDKNGELLFGESHILCNQFNIKILEELAKDKLPYHVAFKKASYMDEKGNVINPTEPNAYKFETLILDMIYMMDDCLSFEVEREKEFAPVKNATGVDSVDTARALLKKNGVLI